MLMELSTGFYENKEAKHQTPAQSKGFLDVVATELSQSREGERAEDIPCPGAVAGKNLKVAG